jgi:hypothetical protein
MINKVMQVRIHKDNESQLLKDIEARKIELGLTSDNAYVRYLLKKDTREIAQNRLKESNDYVCNSTCSKKFEY